MASTLTRKKTRRSRSKPPKVADMTKDELRDMIKTLIDHKLAGIAAQEHVQSAKKITPEMRKRALAATGRFRSGHPDISTEHDEYLATDYRA